MSGRGRRWSRNNLYQRLNPRIKDLFKAPERNECPIHPLKSIKKTKLIVLEAANNNGVDYSNLEMTLPRVVVDVKKIRRKNVQLSNL